MKSREIFQGKRKQWGNLEKLRVVRWSLFMCAYLDDKYNCLCDGILYFLFLNIGCDTTKKIMFSLDRVLGTP
jgi:hypothetical protein